LGSSAGAVLAFGMGPLAAAPAAHADEFDVIIDPIINAIAGSLGGLVDPLAGLDPSASLDVALPAADVASVDSALTLPSDWLGGLSAADPSSAMAVAAAPNSVAEAFQTDFYLPLHTALEDWINSPLGQSIDNEINPLFAVNGFCGLICNGAPGTEVDPTGGNGGLPGGSVTVVTAVPAGSAPTAGPAAMAARCGATAVTAVPAAPIPQVWPPGTAEPAATPARPKTSLV